MEDKYKDLHPFNRSEDLNLFSHWFPKVKDCGIRVPTSVVVKVPKKLWKSFYMEHPEEDRAAVTAWVERSVIPAVHKAGLKGKLLFVKNGSFSNKFNARYCFCLEHELVESIININFQDLCGMGAGITEFVIRERFQHDARVTPCIYSGLPLRSEFRVFYDFDTRQPLYTVNYWDFDYIYEHLYDLTDKIVFEYTRDSLHRIFLAKKDEIQQLVAEHMDSVEGLEGPWSIDIMLTERGEPILIDMATAERSAYWELRPGNEAELAKQKAAEAERKRKYQEFMLTNPIIAAEHAPKADAPDLLTLQSLEQPEDDPF